MERLIMILKKNRSRINPSILQDFPEFDINILKLVFCDDDIKKLLTNIDSFKTKKDLNLITLRKLDENIFYECTNNVLQGYKKMKDIKRNNREDVNLRRELIKIETYFDALFVETMDMFFVDCGVHILEILQNDIASQRKDNQKKLKALYNHVVNYKTRRFKLESIIG